MNCLPIIRALGHPALYRVPVPLPRGSALGRAPRAAPRVVYRLVAAPRAVPRDDTREPAAYLDVGLEEVVVVLGGFSTKVVSVVLRRKNPLAQDPVEELSHRSPDSHKGHLAVINRPCWF